MENDAPTPAELIGLTPAFGEVLQPVIPPRTLFQRYGAMASAAVGILLIVIAVIFGQGDHPSDVFGIMVFIGVLFFFFSFVSPSGPQIQRIDNIDIQLATAFLALEAAGIIALQRRDSTLFAVPQEGAAPSVPALSPEDTLRRGVPLPVARIVRDWLGDDSNAPRRRAGMILAELANLREQAWEQGADGADRSGSELRLTAMLAQAAANGTGGALLHAIADGFAAACVPVRVEVRSQGSVAVPVNYREVPITVLFPHGPRLVEPWGAHTGTADVAPRRDEDAGGPDNFAPGCVLALIAVAIGSGAAWWTEGMDGEFGRLAGEGAAIGAALALAAGSAGRWRGKRWQARGYLALEAPASRHWFGSWATVVANGNNRTHPVQDIFVGSALGYTAALLLSYVFPAILVFLPVVLIALTQPWRGADLSAEARRRIVFAQLGQPVEATAAGAPAPIADDAPPPQPLTIRRVLDISVPTPLPDLFKALAARGPHPLLLLRVFGSDAFPEVRHWVRDWTGIGHVVALEGPDTIAENEALGAALARGDLTAFLTETPDEAEALVQGWFDTPPTIGQFLSTQCTNAAWQVTVELLLARTRLVAMDLSGFCEARAGSRWELQKLADHVPLERVTLLVNVNTDLDFLARQLAQVRASLAPGSPNGGRDVEWRILMIGGSPTYLESESHWEWLRRSDLRLTGEALCTCLAESLAA